MPAIQNKGLTCTEHYSDGNCELCSGDCDTDENCLDDLICYQRVIGEDIDVPGCSWGNSDDWNKFNSKWDYCKLLY